MSKFKPTCTFNALADLSVLLPAAHVEHDVCLIEPPELSASVVPDTLDDEALLGLASKLQQSHQQWQAALTEAASLVKQARALRAQQWAVEARVEQTRAQFHKQKGWRTLKLLVESIQSEARPLDTSTTDLLAQAQHALAQYERRLEVALQTDLTRLAELKAQIEAIENQPAVQAFRAEEQHRQNIERLHQQVVEAQSCYAHARTADDLQRIRADLTALVAQTEVDDRLHGQTEQLLAMIETDLVQARATEQETAARQAREQFGQWIHAVSQQRRADDILLTFALGQAVHLSPTALRSQKGNPRVMLVSAVGFALGEPVVRTLVKDPTRERYYRLEPATGLPARGCGRAFDWQYNGRRKVVRNKPEVAADDVQLEDATLLPSAEVNMCLTT